MREDSSIKKFNKSLKKLDSESIPDDEMCNQQSPSGSDTNQKLNLQLQPVLTTTADDLPEELTEKLQVLD